MSLPKNADRHKSNLIDHGNPAQSTLQQHRHDPPVVPRCALLTGSGRSAVAVIGIRGASLGKYLDQCFVAATPGALLPTQVRYGKWIGPRVVAPAAPTEEGESETGEAVVVTVVKEHELEIHCHGGTAATQRILDDLREVGALLISADDWMSSRSSSLLSDEAQSILRQCLTARTAAIAMDQLRGAMERWVVESRRRLFQSETGEELVRSEAAAMVTAATVGTRLDQPFDVVLIGPPNVGKSSLLNCLVGYDRSITMDVAGTTRDLLHADTVIEGLPVRFSDTAGIRASDEPIEKEGIRRAMRAAEQADLIIQVSQPERTTELPRLGKPGLHVLNIADRLSPNVPPPTDSIQTNALTGQGIDDLLGAIAAALSHSIPSPGTAVPLTNRQADLVGRIADAPDSQQIEKLLLDLIGNDSTGDRS